MSFRALFFGSPAFAVPSLEALHDIATVTAVVCQPDRPAGRGMALTPPAVKTRALELGLPVEQPTKLRTGDFAAWARAQAADVALVVAYGRILPGDVLATTRLGFVNVHASLLPRYRGAAPITWAIVRGEVETGVTLMKLDEGMDTGPTFARVATAIEPDETAGELSERLARRGADAAREWLPRYVAGERVLVAQDDAQATTAPMLDKNDGRIDWSKSARAVHDHVRGMSPWPGAFTTARARTVKIRAVRAVASGRDSQPPGGNGDHGDRDGDAAERSRPGGARAGEVIIADKTRVLVACGGGGWVELVTVQLDGRRPMAGPEWSNGRGIAAGDVLGA